MLQVRALAAITFILALEFDLKYSLVIGKSSRNPKVDCMFTFGDSFAKELVSILFICLSNCKQTHATCVLLDCNRKPKLYMARQIQWF